MLVPYEFLARWNHQTGVLQGAHCKLFDTAAGREGDAQAVAVAGAAGYPLGDILTSIETGALLAMENAKAELAIEQAAHAATKVALEQMQSAKAAADAALVAEQTAHAATKEKLSVFAPMI